MKLPDFRKSEKFNNLKKHMGIPIDVYGSYDVGMQVPLIIKQLALPTGVAIDSLKDISVTEDGTLLSGNNRIILYIKDVSDFEPRFHMANCTTLQKMRDNNQIKKYSATQCETGEFEVYILKNNRAIPSNKRLSVCQNCLAVLSYKGFSMSEWDRTKRIKEVSGFSIKEFFQIYPKSLHVHSVDDADKRPANIYSSDWKSISYKIREYAGWTCQSCNIILASVEKRRFLHVHHIDGVKSNNKNSNLRVLCIKCHAEQPNHQHMLKDSAYVAFIKLFFA